MGQGRHTLRSVSDPVYPLDMLRCRPYVGPIVDMAVTSSASVDLRPPNVTSSMYPRTSSLESDC